MDSADKKTPTAAGAKLARASVGVAVVLVVAWYLVNEIIKLPMIHDVTTDTWHPPVFVAILPLRKDASNPAEYGGADIAEKQKQAYPDIRPTMLPLPPRAAFDRALEVARAAGWEIVAAVPEDNRIEATATTRWLRFKDDVVIRITPAGTGSRVDMRSVSRVGVSDLGANARRIRQANTSTSRQTTRPTSRGRRRRRRSRRATKGRL